MVSKIVGRNSTTKKPAEKIMGQKEAVQNPASVWQRFVPSGVRCPGHKSQASVCPADGRATSLRHPA